MMTLLVSVNGEVWRHISRGSFRLLPSNQFHKEQQPLNLPSVKGEFSDGGRFSQIGQSNIFSPRFSTSWRAVATFQAAASSQGGMSTIYFLTKFAPIEFLFSSLPNGEFGFSDFEKVSFK